MKNLLFFLNVFMLVQCTDPAKDAEITQLQDQLKTYQEKEVLEKETHEGIQKFIADLNAPDWRNRVENSDNGNKEEQKKWISQYQKFRDAYQNMHLDIKHLAIEGDEALLWLKVSATHAGQTTDVIKHVPPTGKEVTWQEVWYFDMQKGVFGKKWDIIVRGLDKMKSVQWLTVPDDYFESMN